LTLGGWIHGIARHFQREPRSRPATLVVETVVEAYLSVVRLDGDRIVAHAESELLRQDRQAIEWIDGPVHRLHRQTAVSIRRPRRDDQQRDDEEKPPSAATRLPH